ncbi:MAG: hypothetical protein ACN4GZ_15870 [Acidimicrobiales bacterium]
MATSGRNMLIVIVLVLAASCTTSSDVQGEGDGMVDPGGVVGPILYVTRDRAEVGDSDDIHGAVFEIERVSLDATACLHFHRITPEGKVYTQLALLAGPPDEIGVDYLRSTT